MNIRLAGTPKPAHPATVSVARARWSVLAAGLAIAVSFVIIATVRLPFIVWSPGAVTDLYAVSDGQAALTVTGVPVYPTSGKLQVAGVQASGQGISLFKGLGAFYDPGQAVVPVSVNGSVGAPIAQVALGADSAEAQRAAAAAALQLAGLPVERAPRVVSVMATGPSFALLMPDDVIEAVGSTTVTSVADFNQAIGQHSVGDTIQLTVTRDDKRLDNQIDVVAGGSNTEQQTPSLGITMADSYLLGGVSVQSAATEIGSGLMLALAIYDIVTPDTMLGTMSVAGAGVIDANGTVTAVAGANERLLAAQAAGAQVYLLPSGNCGNVFLDGLSMKVVAVNSLSQAVDALEALSKGQTNWQVPTCQS